MHGRDPHSLPLLFQPTGSPDEKTTALPSGTGPGTAGQGFQRSVAQISVVELAKAIFPAAAPVTCHVITAWFEVCENFYG